MKKRGRHPSGHGQEYAKGYQCGFQRVRREVVDKRKPRPSSTHNKPKEYSDGLKAGRRAARKRYKK